MVPQSSTVSTHNQYEMALPIAPEDDLGTDIYRGEPPAPPRSPSRSSTSSSSSTSSRGGLGALAAVVEQAISRWARGPSSSSSSSSSSQSSAVTTSRSQLSRRAVRRPSLGNPLNAQSERDITARITQIKAREASRRVPRQFSLYLPPSLYSTIQSPLGSSAQQQITRTTSLSDILSQLELALRKSTRARRNHGKDRASHIAPEDTPHPPHLHYMLPEFTKVPSRPASLTDLATSRTKGKNREPSAISGPIQQHSWFLEVASPTWEDMRAIGKLLHLHPLTLEDILQQDPREKLELFPKLGYYLISFRAVHKLGSQHDASDGRTKTALHDGTIGEANIYLVVFKEGVCLFHFMDVSEHTDRVRHRLVLLEKVISMSSDWIAHGILDSIVDSFFPLLHEIEKEVMAIEDVVFSGAVETPSTSTGKLARGGITRADPASVGFDSETEKFQGQPLTEKNVAQLRLNRIRIHAPFLSMPSLRRISRYFQRLVRAYRKAPATTASSTNATTTTLRRMARIRRLVTSLTRLLATKSEVVTQIRKRLLTTGHPGLGNGSSRSEDLEVAIYMGDVQDHILTLEIALGHYERMLSQSHPIYISQLRTTIAITKGSTDKSLMILTVVSIAVLVIQTIIGIFSLNVNVPHNTIPGGHYYTFGIVIALSCLILTIYVYVVWRWRVHAKRMRGAVL